MAHDMGLDFQWMRHLLNGDLPGTEGTDFHQQDPVGQALILTLELDARTSQRRGR